MATYDLGNSDDEIDTLTRGAPVEQELMDDSDDPPKKPKERTRASSSTKDKIINVVTKSENRRKQKHPKVAMTKIQKLEQKLKALKSGKHPLEGFKKRRWRPGTVALREIKKYQQETDLLVPALPFKRLINEITDEVCINRVDKDGNPLKLMYEKEARRMLQETAEDLTRKIVDFANCLAVSEGRKTLQSRDLCNAIGLIPKAHEITEVLPTVDQMATIETAAKDKARLEKLEKEIREMEKKKK